MKETTDNIYGVLGSFWSRTWQQPELISGLVGGLTNVQQQIQEIYLPARSMMGRESVPERLSYRWRVLDVPETALIRRQVAVGEFNVGDGTLVGAESTRTPRYMVECPYDSVLLICNRPDTPTTVWQYGMDFTIEDGQLGLYSDPTEIFESFAAIDADGETVLTYRLWLCHVDIDIQLLQNLFGLPLGLRFPSSSYYARLLNAAWDCRVEGATEANMNRLLAALVDADVAKTDGAVAAIWEEEDRHWVSVGDELHSAPSAPIVIVGDEVQTGQMLFQGAALYGPDSDIPEYVLPGLKLSAGMIDAKYPGGITLPNREVELTYELREVDGTEVRLPIFSIGGSDEAVEMFQDDMATRLAEYGVDLWEAMTFGQISPYVVNPFDFMRQHVFGNNWMLITLYAEDMGPMQVVGGFLGQLLSCIPKGTSALIFLSVSATLERITEASVADGTPEPFVVSSGEENAIDIATESVLSSRGIY